MLPPSLRGGGLFEQVALHYRAGLTATIAPPLRSVRAVRGTRTTGGHLSQRSIAW
jgi:hypothetical protein